MRGLVVVGDTVEKMKGKKMLEIQLDLMRGQNLYETLWEWMRGRTGMSQWDLMRLLDGVCENKSELGLAPDEETLI